MGALARLDELRQLTRRQFGHMDDRAVAVVRDLEDREARFERLLDFPLGGRRILVVGTGQLAEHARYFALHNDVVGIDLDVVPDRLTPRAVLDSTRANGGVRTLKTVGRRALGIDRQFRQSMARALGVAQLPPVRVVRMDATRMTFPDASFDCVFSQSVFEHIPEPEAAAREIARVLAPGGACHLVVHHYAAEDGHHDLRFPDDRDDVALWAHLRPPHRAEIRSAVYLNEVRLADWMAMFRARFPGVRFELPERDRSLTPALRQLRAAGELAGYSDDELLAASLEVWWRKPSG
jgi:SAM-dependent methyltransferase